MSLKWLRKAFPPSGQQYELFDSSVVLLALGIIGYLMNEPVAPLRALPLTQYISEQQLGFIMTGGAVVAIVLAYTRWSLAGYIVVVFLGSIMSANFLFGWMLTDAGLRPLLSAIIYGYITRNLIVAAHDCRNQTHV